ncbi:MAG: DUF2283 domain-containing protein [Anaerolineae bacterium]
MRITFDPKADAMYIRLQPDGTLVSETREVTEDVLIDLDEDENIIGLEILFASRQIPLNELLSVNSEGLIEPAQVA